MVASWSPLVGGDLSAIRSRGTLRVIFGPDVLPEALSVKPQTAPGLERELLEGFRALHRLQVEFVPLDRSDDLIPALRAGKGDLIVGMGQTDARLREVDFTAEVFPGRHVVVNRRPHPAIDSVEQLRKARVGTIKGSTWAESVAAAGVPRANVDDSFPSAAALLQGLRDEKVSAVVLGLSWAFMERRRDPQLQVGVLLGSTVGRAWAVRKDDSELRQVLDEYIANVRRSGSWNRLVVKYFGDELLEVLRAIHATP
jgi:ABC-type amino acid transport substrate-binding protein